MTPFTGILTSLLLASTLYAADSADLALRTQATNSEPAILIEAGKPIGKVSPLLYGLMTEEINHCYDGGLYAELVQNRALLDDPTTPVHWSMVASGSSASIQLDDKQPLNSALPMSLRLNAPEAEETHPVGIANEGYWGIPIKADTRYRASFYAKAAPGFTGGITVSIQSPDGATVYAQGKAEGISQEWKQYEVVLQTGKLNPTTKARYVLSIQKPGTIWFSLVSLFPPTWKDRPNGFRKDLIQMMLDLKPRFLRFPGGNYLEGDTVKNRFDWKKTVGPISERTGHMGPWRYRSTDGIGLMEFLTWCQDMQAEPILAVYAGFSFKEQLKAGPELEPFVQEALEEIEYVTGPVSSKWGAQRAKDGHPEPFKLHYVEIGNEDFFDKANTYDARFTQFYDAIKAKYPDLNCISSVNPIDPPQKWVRSRKPDLLDEHLYHSTEEFLGIASSNYDKYDRKGPKIFVGEWASREDKKIRPMNKAMLTQAATGSMKATLGDAAFMTAMERNSDLVLMQCYAPLFVNVNEGAWQWRPNLIGYDALHCYGSPSYYAFKMFSTNLGDQLLRVVSKDTSVLACATRDSKTGEVLLKLVNAQSTPQALKIQINGVTAVGSQGTATILSASPEETNTLEQPMKVAPKNSVVKGIRNSFSYEVPANGIVVLRLKTR